MCIRDRYISEGSYVNEGDLVAHIKSTDLDMQQDNLESQLKICLLYTSRCV